MLQLAERPREKIVLYGENHRKRMRDGYDKWKARMKLDAKTREAADAKNQLEAVTSVLPDAASLVGRTAHCSVLGRNRKLQARVFNVAVRAVHMRTKKRVKIGVNVK